MQREQYRRNTGDSRREHQIPPTLAGSTRKSERHCDDRGLLNPGDSPLGKAKLREQTQRKNQAEHRTPTQVEDLIALLIDVPREPIDQVDQSEVDRQRRQRRNQGHRLQPARTRDMRRPYASLAATAARATRWELALSFRPAAGEVVGAALRSPPDAHIKRAGNQQSVSTPV